MAQEESTNLKTAKLIMVTSGNNNKYYEMKENGDGTFTVQYGRVGGRATTRRYQMYQWNSKYNEKVRKGYKDQTHLFAEVENEIELLDIDDPQINDLMNALMLFANKSVSNNYNVSAEQVTQKQVNEAQRILDLLVGKAKVKLNIKNFNDLLLELYQVIPRKMKNVREHLIESVSNKQELEELENKLIEEQATLDVMRGQVDLSEKKKEAQKEDKEKLDLLGSMGIEVENVTDDAIIHKIKDLMQDESDKFYRAFEIKNHKTQTAFDGFMDKIEDKKLELFWHGSRNENWLSILESGLVLRPANAIISGKMFGYGLYFADKFRKSLNYTSLRGSYWTSGSASKGFLALYEVHVGKQLHIKNHEAWCYELSEENLKKRGNYDSLFAEGGADLRNNEYIIYNQAQCTVKYLVEVR